MNDWLMKEWALGIHNGLIICAINLVVINILLFLLWRKR